MEPINIGIVSSAFPPRHTGAGLRASRLVTLVAKNPEFRPQVLTLDDSGQHERTERFGDVPVIRIPSPPPRTGRIGRLLAQFRERAIGRRAGSVFIKAHPRSAILHIFGSTWFTLGALSSASGAHRPGLILEGTLLGTDDLDSLLSGSFLGRLQALLFGRAIRGVDLHVCPAPEFSEACRRQGVEDHRIWQRPHPVDTSLFRPPSDSGELESLRRAFNLNPSVPVVVMVGRFQPRKDQMYLLRAMKAVRNRCQLVLLGPVKRAADQQYVADCRSLAATLPQSIPVYFNVGSFENIPEWLRSADVLAFSSTSEGFPNVVLEALASGLRVLVRSESPHPWGVNPKPWNLSVVPAAAPPEEFGNAVDALIQSSTARGWPRRIPSCLPDLGSSAEAYMQHYRQLLPSSRHSSLS